MNRTLAVVAGSSLMVLASCARPVADELAGVREHLLDLGDCFLGPLVELGRLAGKIGDRLGRRVWADSHTLPLEAGHLIATQEEIAIQVTSSIASEYGIIARRLSAESRTTQSAGTFPSRSTTRRDHIERQHTTSAPQRRPGRPTPRPFCPPELSAPLRA